MLASPAWLSNVDDASSPVGAKDLARAVNGVLADLRGGGLAAVDLSRVERTDPSPEHLVALLRSLYSWRAEISGWRGIEAFARSHFARSGLDAERLLRGLEA